MSKGRLFIFGIGGTGSRVIKALTLLLASGVQAETEEIIPIIIDPHLSNEDLRRTVELLSQYQTIYNKLNTGVKRKGFFNTPIRRLKDLVPDAHLANDFAFNLQNVQNEQFREYINLKGMDETNKALMELLFSTKNLDTEMDIGFVGNPNIGSIVLNQFKDSDEFKLFASKFAQGDRIFIISSIFGGTGAAGFPLILKNIRESKITGVDNDFLKRAPIGAVTVLPYFGVQVGEGLIEKSTFMSKTKAALTYYENNVTGNNSINALYYIGDEMKNDYKNDDGHDGQKNDAHFIELASALSIIDFLKTPLASLANDDKGKAVKPIYREFGINEDERTMIFKDLGKDTQDIIKKPLTQYLYFCRYLRDELQDAINAKQTFTSLKEPKIDNSFTTSYFNTSVLAPFNKGFEDWLNEMARNERGFAPFNLSTPILSELLNGMKTKRNFIGREKRIEYADFNHELNAFSGKNYPSVETKLIEAFSGATDVLLPNFYESF